ncbi:hypothetical protein FKD06_23895 [Serratia sp. SRS-8-S-2018]|uniref:hypothetical protein n=1 Tax=Serratia sp. SRS-8-S-2018 TaxID=2591107 RepID=UPI001140436C|nr:hypothetical protein [Serratia sp. SRS-8-S-2018]TPW41854.1 hypothetical protein FKD06_23895 [Serratia sp. SRS-8-S-2018]
MIKATATYALTVCFLCMCVFLYSFGELGYSTIRVFNPKFTLPASDVAAYRNNNAYWRSLHENKESPPANDVDTIRPRPPKDVLTLQRQDALNDALASEKQAGLQSLIQFLIHVLLASLIFTVHVFLIGCRRKKCA